MFKIIQKSTGKTLGTVLANQSLDLEKACDLAGVRIMRTAEDFANEDGYDVEDLDMDWEDEKK